MIVIDANIWVSFFLPRDVNHQLSQLWLTQHVAANQLWFAPTLLLAEVAGAIARRTNQISQGEQALNQIVQLQSLQLIELDQSLGLVAANLAASLQIKGADAIYVAVAQQLGLPLLTLDKEVIVRANKIIQVQTF